MSSAEGRIKIHALDGGIMGSPHHIGTHPVGTGQVGVGPREIIVRIYPLEES